MASATDRLRSYRWSTPPSIPRSIPANTTSAASSSSPASSRSMAWFRAASCSSSGLICSATSTSASRSLNLLPLPDHDHPTLRDDEPLPVGVRVHPDLRPFRDPDVLVDDGLPDDGVRP